MDARYVSFCEKYTSRPFYAMSFPVAASLVAGYDYFSALTFAGAICGVLSEAVVPCILRRKAIGIGRGSKILRRVQVGFVAAGIILGGGVEYTSSPYEPIGGSLRKSSLEPNTPPNLHFDRANLMRFAVFSAQPK